MTASESQQKTEDLKPVQKATDMIADRPLGWLLALVVPIGVYLILDHWELNENTTMFVSIISISLIMWVFSLLPAFIPPLFAILLFLLFGLAPSGVVLSGFSSNVFFLTISVLGLGVVISSTGLSYRYTLWLLKSLPQNTFWYQTALFCTGLIFTPVVPTILGRTSIASPVFNSTINGIDPMDRPKSVDMLYSSGLDGVTYLSAIFLTGAPANFFIFGLLPVQDQQAYQFINWFLAASVAGIIMFVMYFVLSSILFRAYGRVRTHKVTIIKKLDRLGPLSTNEWIAILCVVVLGIGVVSTAFHKIKIPFIAFAVFFILLFLGIFNTEDFKKKLDWTFLFLMGSVLGIVATMNYLGIDELMASNLSWLGKYMRHDFRSFILILTTVILLVRFFLPIGTTNFIFATALLPLAHAGGVSPWVVGFIILIISETSFFTYQSPHIMLYHENSGRNLPLNQRKLSFFRFLLLLVKIFAIYASVPYWSWLGVL